MERVTEFCYQDCQKAHGKPKKIKVLFSKRGGHSYGQTKAYWEILKAQAAGNSTYLKRRQIRHQMLAFQLVDYVPHYLNPGLQLADIVASATYQAVETTGKNWDIEPVKKLTDRFPKEGGCAADFGFVLQPTPPDKANLNDDQKMIFEHFGYTFGSTKAEPSV